MSAELSLEAIERGLVAQGVPKDKARAVALDTVAFAAGRGHKPAPIVRAELPAVARLKVTTAGLEGEAEHIEAQAYADGGLWLKIPYPPRTKKNGGAGGYMGIKQRPAYCRYRDFIVKMMQPLLEPLHLPLPLRPYNLKAVYYVDARGKAADLFGLHQGLADALQNAEVIANDWYFRTTNGSRIVVGDPKPRIEIEITPLPDEPLTGPPLPTAA